MLTVVHHLSLSWAKWTYLMPTHPVYLQSILILTSDHCVWLPSSLFPSGFPTTTLYTLLFSPAHAICPAHHILLDFRNIWWPVQIIKLLIMQFSPFSCYCLPRRTKYLPEHPILKQPSSVFSSSVRDLVSHPYQRTGRVRAVFVLTYHICAETFFVLQTVH